MIVPATISQQTKVITGVCRWAYVNVWQPRPSDHGGKPKYSVVLIIPKRDTATLQKIHDAIAIAYEVGKLQLQRGSMTLPALNSISTPLHDGDTEHLGDPAYADSMYLTASSITIPTLVDASHQPIADRSKVYSGVYGRANISFYTYNTCKTYSARNASNPYNSDSAKGIACCLHSLMKVKDGTPLSCVPFRTSASDDFSVLE